MFRSDRSKKVLIYSIFECELVQNYNDQVAFRLKTQKDVKMKNGSENKVTANKKDVFISTCSFVKSFILISTVRGPQSISFLLKIFL